MSTLGRVCVLVGAVGVFFGFDGVLACGVGILAVRWVTE